MVNSYSTSAIIAFSLLFLTLGFTSAGIIWQYEQADYGYFWFNPIFYGKYLDDISTIFFDDVTLTVNGKIIFKDSFDNYNLSDRGWQPSEGTFIQRNISHTPPNALAFHHSGPSMDGLPRDVHIGENWETINFTSWIWIPDYFPIAEAKEIFPKRDYNKTSTGLGLQSHSSGSSLTGSIHIEYIPENDTFKNYLRVIVHYRDEEGIPKYGVNSPRAYNYSSPFSPFQWYKMSLFLDRPNQTINLYIDDNLVIQYPLETEFYYESFDGMGIHGWIP